MGFLNFEGFELLNIKSAVIQWQLSKHAEVTKKGVPKGHKIGLSKKKRQAAYLVELYKYCPKVKHKEIAAEVGVSPGLIRKWNTEGDFRRAKEEIRKVYDKIQIRLASHLDFEILAGEMVRRYSRRVRM